MEGPAKLLFEYYKSYCALVIFRGLDYRIGNIFDN
jgi:hypothetical protein